MVPQLPGILPQMTIDEALDVTRIYSVADQLPAGTPLIQNRPFRSPHHTISHAGLVGGGNWPHPGEISLAHRGVLFLDELPEFERRVLESRDFGMNGSNQFDSGDTITYEYKRQLDTVPGDEPFVINPRKKISITPATYHFNRKKDNRPKRPRLDDVDKSQSTSFFCSHTGCRMCVFCEKPKHW